MSTHSLTLTVVLCYAGMAVRSAAGPTLWYDRPATRWADEALPLGNGRIGCMLFGGVEDARIQFNVDSLWTGDENPSGGYETPGMGAYQTFGDVILLSGGGSSRGVSCPSGHKAFYTTQEVDATVDGNPATKWCVEHHGRPVVWQFALPKGDVRVVSGYTFQSGDDVPSRDPKAWILEGSDDGETWRVLDKRKGEPGFEGRVQNREYVFENETPYHIYRITFTENHGGVRYQLSEISLRGVSASASSGASDYRRELDLGTGVHRVTFVKDGARFTRETFCSHPDQVVALRLTADKPGQCSGAVRLKGAHGETTLADDARLTMQGTLANGLKYEAQLGIRNEGGSVRIDGDRLVFVGCNAVTVILAAGTDYAMDPAKGWRGAHPHEAVTRQVDAAIGMTFAQLRERHVADHASLFGRVVLDVGRTTAAQLALPVDQRLAAIKAGKPDPDLVETLFQYGRYLLMGSSRPGTLPANLQGVWNDSNNPPWHADYHSNINLQMNYWLAEPANLAECHLPLFDLLVASLEPFREGSRASFKGVRGFTVRTSHNIYGGMGWKWNLPAGAWYAQHFWEHYAYGCDKEFLRRTVYPYLKEVCQFWEDRLKELPDGTLVVPMGWSPEHGPEEDGCSYDQQIVWDLFSNYIEASEALDVDADYRKTVAAMRAKLAGPRIGKWGQLQEWMSDRDDASDRHRHTSHLFAVYPGRQISITATPAFAKAAQVSLEARGETGDSRRSWTWPWRCALWARFGQAEKCHHMITSLLQYNTLPNLITTHPPLQLDGSFGITAGICEMLLQSHAGEIHLLPALPSAWPTGSVKGLRARGGFEVDITWKDGSLTSATIRSSAGRPCVLRYGPKTSSFETSRGKTYVFNRTLQSI